jgi:hypothetical protein
VATKKQRKRRSKLKRHEYEYVIETEDGEEVPLETLRDEGKDDRASGAKREPALVDRRGRPVQKPTFERVIRRAAIFAPILFLFVWFTSRDRLSVVGVALNTLILVAFFIPFSYLVDRMVYRMVLRRNERERAERRR